MVNGFSVMSDMPTWVINLAHANQRKMRIERHLAQRGVAPVCWFSAIDGRLLSAAEQASAYVPSALVRRAGRAFSSGELGCALSHRGVWQQIVSSNAPYALVLEDDAVLAPDIMQRLAELAPLLSQSKSALVTLGRLRLFTSAGARTMSTALRLVKPVRAWGGYAYVINRAAAAELLALQQLFRCMADDWLYYQAHTDIEVWGLDRFLAAVVPADSHLESDRRYFSHHKPTSWWRVLRIVDRCVMFWREWRLARATPLLSHNSQQVERVFEDSVLPPVATKLHEVKSISQK